MLTIDSDASSVQDVYQDWDLADFRKQNKELRERIKEHQVKATNLTLKLARVEFHKAEYQGH